MWLGLRGNPEPSIGQPCVLRADLGCLSAQSWPLRLAGLYLCSGVGSCVWQTHRNSLLPFGLGLCALRGIVQIGMLIVYICKLFFGWVYFTSLGMNEVSIYISIYLLGDTVSERGVLKSYPVHMEYVMEWRDGLDTIENVRVTW